MTTCRDWLSTLWPASYRGVPFYVERDSGEYGKRVQVHEYPNRDRWYPEELGQRARYYRVTGYLASDSIDTELSVLVEACTRQGGGTLVLPLEGQRQAICLKVQTERRKDRHGYIAVDLEFVEDPGFGPAPWPLPYFSGLVGQAASALATVLEAGFATAAADYGNGLPDHVRDAVADAITAVAVAIEAERGTVPLAAAQAATIAQVLVDLYAAAVPLARGEAVPIGADVEVASIPAAIGAAVTAFRAAAEPKDAAGALRRAANALPLDDAATGPATGSATGTTALAAREAQLVRRIGAATIAAGFAVVVAEQTFETRREAIQARADLAVLFSVVLGATERPDEIAALARTRDAAIEYVSRTIADLAPVIEVSAPRSMPAVWWAHRLYADAGRAEALVARNGASHPSFMPQTIEALAR